MLLGHASIQTTEKYLGMRQNLVEAVNDKLGIVDAAALPDKLFAKSMFVVERFESSGQGHRTGVVFRIDRG